MTNRDNLVGFMAGACAGAAVALLFAPQSGRHTRRQIKDAGTNAMDQINETGSRVRQAGETIVNETKTKLTDARQGVKRTLHQTGEKAVAAAEHVVEGARTRLNGVNGVTDGASI